MYTETKRNNLQSKLSRLVLSLVLVVPIVYPQNYIHTRTYTELNKNLVL